MSGMGYIENRYGVIIPVIRVELTGGAFMVTGRRKGPLRAYSGPATLVGDDGHVIAGPEETEDNSISWPVVPRGAWLTLSMRCAVGSPLPIIQGELINDDRTAALETGPRELTA